ncbi:MAG TPA: hypothetical protein VF169_18855 [Albitalea sp.]|uniref:hypothetical protein n=1 Tax=Piscinibacter sp. TaxID=1903157 RepID=UPI002ED0375A
MKPFKHFRPSWQSRLAGACVALLACFSCLASVLALFASATGELEPVLAKLRVAPAASTALVKAPAKPARS